VLATHWGRDIGGWALTRELSRRLRVRAVGGRWSRLLIDLNRRVDDPSLVRCSARGVELSWNRALRPSDVERRVLRFHAPYHEEVDRTILARLVRGVRPLLFAVHTFTPVYRGRPRPFQIGLLYEHHAALAHRMGRSLRGAGLSVRYNQPYSGMAGMMYSVHRHGKHHGLPCLEIEVNHSMLGTGPAVLRLGSVVASALGDLIG
jgi:predicted N-formylglutamate amidohydrolase